MTAHPEGRLLISLPAKPCHLVRIENTIPVAPASQFAGRHPKEAKSLVPLVYSICKAAQTADCEDAFERALTGTSSPRKAVLRRLLTLSETAREHGLQILHARPRCLGATEPALASSSIKKLLHLDWALSKSLTAVLQGDESAIDTARHLVLDLDVALGEAIFGELPWEWHTRRGFKGLSSWASRNETPAQTMITHVIQMGFADAGAVNLDPLPDLRSEDMEAELFAEDAEAYIAGPAWKGRPRKTTPLAQQNASLVQGAIAQARAGLLARLTACLAELAAIPARMLALTGNLLERKSPGFQTPRANILRGFSLPPSIRALALS